jgi:pimeloyl-ACP methyl ester carboxylesterase
LFKGRCGVNSRVSLAAGTWLFIVLAMAFMAFAEPDQADVYGPELEGFEYPFTTERFTFPSQGQISSMTFMDVMPNKPNGHTVVLLHGKNFCAATWEATIKTSVEVGYRVIAPDQIGFCKSTKPERHQYSF